MREVVFAHASEATLGTGPKQNPNPERVAQGPSANVVEPFQGSHCGAYNPFGVELFALARYG